MKKEQRENLPESMREPLGFITLHEQLVQWMEKKNYSPHTIYGCSYHLYAFF